MNETEKQPIKKEAEVLLTNLAITQAWLCNYDLLKNFSYHKHELKHVMKRGCDLLEKHSDVFLNLMFEKDEKTFQTYVASIEYITKLIATKGVVELVAMVETFRNYESQIAEKNETT